MQGGNAVRNVRSKFSVWNLSDGNISLAKKFVFLIGNTIRTGNPFRSQHDKQNYSCISATKVACRRHLNGLHFLRASTWQNDKIARQHMSDMSARIYRNLHENTLAKRDTLLQLMSVHVIAKLWWNTHAQNTSKEIHFHFINSIFASEQMKGHKISPGTLPKASDWTHSRFSSLFDYPVLYYLTWLSCFPCANELCLSFVNITMTS